jgi:hypothetical protein
MVRKDLAKRHVDLYLPSDAIKSKWESVASERHVSLSKFIYEMVEAALANESDISLSSQEELSKLIDENRSLRQDIEAKEALIDRRTQELYRVQHLSFLESTETEGKRPFDKELISILKASSRAIPGQEVLARLRVNPLDTDKVIIISKQLEILQHYGLIQETSLGWKWQR